LLTAFKNATQGVIMATRRTKARRAGGRAAAKTHQGKAQTPAATDGQTATDAANDPVVCPECGRSFTRAAALGAHRRAAHGVAGSSKIAQRKRASSRTAAGSNGGSTRTRSATASARQAPKAAATSTTSPDPVDRDRLLQTLFPKGIPARESVVRSINSWLDEAERLSRES
jgi:hypothetical protein